MLSSLLRSPLAKVSVRYGALGGLLGMGFLASFYYLGKHPLLINPFLDFRVPLFAVLLFFALKEVRDFFSEGVLHFWQGMIGGFVFTATFALLCAVFLLVFTALQPGFVSSFISIAMEQTKAFSAEDIEKIGRTAYEEGVRALQTTDGRFMATRYFFQSFIIGFFISIIISVILRRQPKTD
ncbi:MAG: DUF4199 domain-containing protein [Cyclobacteriaceae bacterium]|nr:DUF4199 domain-containing protein [Cyclobacteriaceae bacterium]